MEKKMQEKMIDLILYLDSYFEYDEIDEFYMSDTDYNGLFNGLSDKLDELFDELGFEELEGICSLEKSELFTVEIGDRFINNPKRKKIVDFMHRLPLNLDIDLVKENIKNDYRLANYIDRSKVLDLVSLNENVIMYVDIEYLTEDIIYDLMKKSDIVTKVFLGLTDSMCDLYFSSSMFLNSKKINDLLYKQSIKYLDSDITCYVKASDIVKCNKDIAKYVVSKDARMIHYVNESIRKEIR